jgi:hypothetical protein
MESRSLGPRSLRKAQIIGGLAFWARSFILEWQLNCYLLFG